MTICGGAIVDLGNVVIDFDHNEERYQLMKQGEITKIPVIPGSLESLKMLNKALQGNITIVYKGTTTPHEIMMKWLQHVRFTEETGIPFEKVVKTVTRNKYSLLTKPSNEINYKTIIVIDDRLEVLSYFVKKVPYLILFRPFSDEIEKFRHIGALEHTHLVYSWHEINLFLKPILHNMGCDISHFQ